MFLFKRRLSVWKCFKFMFRKNFVQFHTGWGMHGAEGMGWTRAIPAGLKGWVGPGQFQHPELPTQPQSPHEQTLPAWMHRHRLIPAETLWVPSSCRSPRTSTASHGCSAPWDPGWPPSSPSATKTMSAVGKEFLEFQQHIPVMGLEGCWQCCSALCWDGDKQLCE